LRSGGRLGDGLGRLAGRTLPLNSEVAERLLGSACYSPARIEHELGWRAGIGIDEGVREMLGAGLPLLSKRDFLRSSG
jgi:nucleoside-diphosphate-sugar epimerase